RISGKQSSWEAHQQHATHHLAEASLGHSHTPLITVLVTFANRIPVACCQSMGFRPRNKFFGGKLSGWEVEKLLETSLQGQYLHATPTMTMGFGWRSAFSAAVLDQLQELGL